MFRYDPKDASDALPAGEYPTVLEKVTETESKGGKPMLKVQWCVYAERERTLFDYIVNPSTLWKLKAIAKALDKMADFNAGTFDLNSHLGANISLKLEVETNEQYGEQNVIKGYGPSQSRPAAKVPFPATTKPRQAATSATANKAPVINEEDIPF